MSSLKSKIFKSSGLLILVKLIQRSIGLISILILARLLTPEDFGIVAISALVTGFCIVLSGAGSQQYIIQKKNVDNADLNSAWTFNLFNKIIIWLALIALVPYISQFYNNPELNLVLYISATILLIGAVRSPGVMLLKRELNYKPIFNLLLTSKIISFISAMCFVFFEPSYWAIIFGTIVASLSKTIGSYFIHPAKPRICIKKIKEQWLFSKWVLLKSGLGYIRGQIDNIIIAKLFSTQILGGFHLAKRIAVLPNTEIINPAIEPLLSGFAKIKNDPGNLTHQFTISFIAISSLIIPSSVFIYYFPETIVNFFLGSQWTEAIPMMSNLSLLVAATSVGYLLTQLCTSLAKVKTLFFYDTLSLILIVTILLMAFDNNINNFILLRGMLGLGLSFIFLAYISRNIVNLSITNLIIVTAPILFSAWLSAQIIILLAIPAIEITILNLLLHLIIYGLSFLTIMFFSYQFYFKKKNEWQYFYNMIKKILYKAKKKYLKAQI